jgi:hypothetical protein
MTYKSEKKSNFTQATMPIPKRCFKYRLFANPYNHKKEIRKFAVNNNFKPQTDDKVNDRIWQDHL